MAAALRTAIVVLALAIGLGAQQAQAPTGMVLGRVVDADSGEGIPGVLVSIGPRQPPATPPSAPLPRALTDAQGRFLLDGVGPGSYVVRASVGGNGFSPSGFLVTGIGHQIGAYLNGSFGQRRPGGPDDVVELTVGAPHASDVVIRLWKGAAIEGTVVDEAGDPIVGAYVTAVQRASDGGLLTGPSTRSDDRGWFRIGTLRPGEYVLLVPNTQFFLPGSSLAEMSVGQTASAVMTDFTRTGAAPPSTGGIAVGSSVAVPVSSTMAAATTTRVLPHTGEGGPTLAYQTTFYPSATAVARATPIALRAGETKRGLTIRMEPTATTRVSGRLLDATGPVPHFGIHMMLANAGRGADAIEVATTVTDARGSFEFPAVHQGSYTLRAVREPTPSAGPGVQAPAPARPSETSGAFAIEPVAVASAPVSGLELLLRPGHRLTGRVVFAGSTPPPANPRAVSLGLVAAPPVSRTTSAASTSGVDAQGAIEFQPVPSGRYILQANSPAAWPLLSVVVDGQDVTDRPFDVGRDLADVVVTFSDQPASVGGTVRAAPGVPLADLSVFLFPAERSRWTEAFDSTRSFRTVRVGLSGTVEFTPVLPGAYLVAVVRDDANIDWPDPRLLARLAAVATRVEVIASRPSQVSLTAVELR